MRDSTNIQCLCLFGSFLGFALVILITFIMGINKRENSAAVISFMIGFVLFALLLIFKRYKNLQHEW